RNHTGRGPAARTSSLRSSRLSLRIEVANLETNIVSHCRFFHQHDSQLPPSPSPSYPIYSGVGELSYGLTPAREGSERSRQGSPRRIPRASGAFFCCSHAASTRKQRHQIVPAETSSWRRSRPATPVAPAICSTSIP